MSKLTLSIDPEVVAEARSTVETGAAGP